MDDASDVKEINVDREDPTPVLPRDETIDKEEAIEKVHSLKQATEALLFATDAPLSIRKLMALIHPFTPCTFEEIKKSLEVLSEEYLERTSAFELKEVAGGYLLQTHERFYPILDNYFQKQTPQRLSPAAYEVLATIAYRQPITRAEIDVIRGVDSSGPLSSLTERELIKVVGRKEVPGYPPLYGTTPDFLKLCGLGSIKDLPELQEFKKPKKRKAKKNIQKKTEDKPKKAQEINLTLPF